MPYLKIINYCILLSLNYSNASLTLPKVVSQPDIDFLAVTLTIVVALCISAFSSGYLLARFSQVSNSETVSLIFGLGMNNNGTGFSFWHRSRWRITRKSCCPLFSTISFSIWLLLLSIWPCSGAGRRSRRYLLPSEDELGQGGGRLRSSQRVLQPTSSSDRCRRAYPNGCSDRSLATSQTISQIARSE